jgi:DNA-directed RNA polymerase omega subunit
MARFTSEKAAEMVGGRFNLVLVASQRSRELKNGATQRVEGKDATFNVTALREIEEGKYTYQDYLNKLHKKERQE